MVLIVISRLGGDVAFLQELLNVKWAVPARLGWLAVTVQPGCTNLWLGTLLHSRTNADDDGRIGGSRARARLNTNREWPAFAHTLILGEHTTNVNNLPTLRFFAVGDAVENESG
jgi:hypothetical protein